MISIDVSRWFSKSRFRINPELLKATVSRERQAPRETRIEDKYVYVASTMLGAGTTI